MKVGTSNNRVKFILSCIITIFIVDFGIISADFSKINKIKYDNKPDFEEKRRPSGLEEISSFELSKINDSLYKRDDYNNKISSDLISSKGNNQAHTLDMQILKVNGNVQIQPVGDSRKALTKNSKINLWDKIFTNDRSSLVLGYKDNTILEISKNTSFLIKKIDHEKITIDILQIEGKIRAIVKNGFVNMETLNSSILIPKGKIDIMISGMNTLIAPRESDVLVSAQKGVRKAKLGSYTLVTSKGVMISSTGKSDRKKDKDASSNRLKSKKSFMKIRK